MSRRCVDLVCVSALAAIAAGLALLNVSSVLVRLPFALLLLFVLPGYALTAAILGRALMNLERLLLTLGLSLVSAILSGLVLNWSPWGLRAETWASLLAIITIGASFLAFVRWPAMAATSAQPLARPGIVGSLLFGLAAVVVVGATILASNIAARIPSTKVTQLWMLPGQGPDSGAIQVGIRNESSTSATFRLQIQQGNTILDELPAIVISAGGTFQTLVTLDRIQPSAGPIEAFLYRADAPGIPYRHVLFWLTPQEQ